MQGIFRRFPAACGKGVCDGGSTATKTLVESAASRGNRSGGSGSFANTTEECATFVATLVAQRRVVHKARGENGLPKENEFAVVLISCAPDDGSAFGDWKALLRCLAARASAFTKACRRSPPPPQPSSPRPLCGFVTSCVRASTVCVASITCAAHHDKPWRRRVPDCHFDATPGPWCASCRARRLASAFSATTWPSLSASSSKAFAWRPV